MTTIASSGVTRRSVLAGATALPLAQASAGVGAGAGALPDRSSFAGLRGVYLDAGTQHPVALPARRAIDAYFAGRGDGGVSLDAVERRVKERFARLVGATPAQLAFVPSTTAGEQMVLDALDIPRSGGRIVTDTLHFFGSFYLYEEMARRGIDVVWLRQADGRVPIDAYARAITPATRLVAVSLVSTYNGFEHDLARLCELAHAKGALVYADIIHAAGTIPLDLAASGVDFAACASYKWLMGDFGLGFLYVRAQSMERLRRARFGYYQLARFTSHAYPFDPPGERVADAAPRDDAEGLFAMGTRPHAAIVHLDWSLGYIEAIGVERIVAHRTPLMQRLRAGLSDRGYAIVTPEDSRTPLLTCTLQDARGRLGARLDPADIRITLSANRFRVSPSVFNTIDDIDHLLDALPKASSA